MGVRGADVDWEAVWSRVPDIMGMPGLVLRGRYWQGPYRLDGSAHPRRDKLTVTRGREGAPVVMEQGDGHGMKLTSWLIQYAGVEPRAVYRVLRGYERVVLPVTEQEWRGDPKYVDWWVWRNAGGGGEVRNPFAEYLRRGFPAEDVARVLEKYHVTDGLPARGTGVLGTRWWYVDRFGRICHDKTMWYREDGHRDKEQHPIRQFKCKWGYVGKCFFGEDSVGAGGSVKIVESEKTAILATLMYGGNWVATGGMNGLPLRDRWYDGRKVWLVPDVDGADEWARHGEVWRWWEKCSMKDRIGPKWDIGDLVVMEKNM